MPRDPDELPPFRLLLVGDTSFGENYQDRLVEQGGTSILETMGYDHGLVNLDPLMGEADLVIANLETPITDRTDSDLADLKRYIHRADVTETPAALARHDIDVVSLANNHAMDHGIEGLHDTMDALDGAGILYFGADFDEAGASRPFVIETPLRGTTLRIVVASGFEYRRSYHEDFDFYADGTNGGVNDWSRTNARHQMQALRAAYPEALLIAYPHWGRNYTWKIDRQTRLAHTLIDAGADLVIGHGAHALQEIETYRGRWIIYGLGNFVFNSPGRYEREDQPPFSFGAMLEVGGGLDTPWLALRLYPILSDNRITNYQPRFATADEMGLILELLKAKSEEAGGDPEALGEGVDAIGPHLVLDVTPIIGAGDDGPE